MKAARLHAHAANQQLDGLHKPTTRLTRKYSETSIEDLHVAGMAKNHHLAKPIMDAAFGESRRQLEYKTARSGARLHVTDRRLASSKTCPKRESVKTKPSPAERTYRRDNRGLTTDRNLNTAINIQAAGNAPETPNTHRATARRSNRSSSSRATQAAAKREPNARRPGAANLRAGDHKDAPQANVR